MYKCKIKGRIHCRWMNDLPIRDGDDALKVNLFETTIKSESGRKLYHNSFATDIPVDRDNLAELAECARARWKVENDSFKVLKVGYHLEHNLGHGPTTLASLMAMFNMIALLIQSARDIWKKARAKIGTRYRFPDHLKFLLRNVVHQDFGTVMKTIINGELPGRPPGTRPEHQPAPPKRLHLLQKFPERRKTEHHRINYCFLGNLLDSSIS